MNKKLLQCFRCKIWKENISYCLYFMNGLCSWRRNKTIVFRPIQVEYCRFLQYQRNIPFIQLMWSIFVNKENAFQLQKSLSIAVGKPNIPWNLCGSNLPRHQIFQFLYKPWFCLATICLRTSQTEGCRIVESNFTIIFQLPTISRQQLFWNQTLLEWLTCMSTLSSTF